MGWREKEREARLVDRRGYHDELDATEREVGPSEPNVDVQRVIRDLVAGVHADNVEVVPLLDGAAGKVERGEPLEQDVRRHVRVEQLEQVFGPSHGRTVNS